MKKLACRLKQVSFGSRIYVELAKQNLVRILCFMAIWKVWGEVEKLIILLICNGFYLENNEVQKAKSIQINALCR